MTPPVVSGLRCGAMRSCEILLALLPYIACQPAESAGSRGSTAATLPAHGSGRAQGCPTELVGERPARGVIFTDVCTTALASSVKRAVDGEVVGYFRPTAALIQTLESGLRPALELGRTRPESLRRMQLPPEEREEEVWGVREALGEILKDLAAYRRQYVGIVVRGGARRVLVNFFPEVAADGRDDFPDWTVRFVDYVDDGGAQFWKIEYDAGSGKFHGFDWNPSG